MEVSHSHVIKKYEMKVVFLDIWQLECSIKNFKIVALIYL